MIITKEKLRARIEEMLLPYSDELYPSQMADALVLLAEALDRINVMCDIPPKCRCGRPNGLPAVVQCSNRSLADAAKILGLESGE